jgi:hypothetical protein
MREDIDFRIIDSDNLHRPPNAFNLYFQAMRSQIHSEYPSLSKKKSQPLYMKNGKIFHLNEKFNTNGNSMT